MRSVTYESILQKVCQLCFGQSEANLEDQATLSIFIDERLSQYWREFWWPEACEVEERTFRASYSSATNYTASTATAATEVYFAPTQSYYQCLRPNGPGTTVKPPATLVGATWTDDLGYWAPSAPDYSGNDWLTGTIYAKGDAVRNPDDGRFYACHTAHTAGASFDTASFGILTPFLRTIALSGVGLTEIDAVEYITEQDPRVFSGQRHIPFDLFAAIVVRTELPVVWVKFRRVVKSWTGAAHVAGTSYSVGQQVYYGTDYYRRVSGSGTQLPTDSSFWELLPVPFIFRSGVPRAAYADWLDAEGQQDKSGAEERRAQRLIDREVEIIQFEQNQSRRLNVRTQ